MFVTPITILLSLASLSNDPITSFTLSAEQIEAAQLVLRGMSDSRERLVSGICRIKGTTTTTRMENARDTVIREQVDCFCAFDFEAGLYRFDRNPSSEPGTTRGGKFIRTQSHIYQALCTSTGSEAVLAVHRDRLDGTPFETIEPFDIRCIGLCTVAGLSWDFSLERFYELFSVAKLVEFSEESKGVYRLAWVLADTSPVKETFWFDAERGYTWIRREAAPIGGKVPFKQLAETSWEEIQGAWVPIALHVADVQLGGKLRRDADWQIVWESVNEPVPEEYFKPEDFSSEQDVQLYSEELGKPVFLGYVGGEHSVLALDESPTKWRRILSVIGGVVLLLVVVIIAAFRHRRPRQA